MKRYTERIGLLRLEKELAERLNITDSAAKKMIREFINIIKEHILSGDEVYLTGLGKFYVREGGARTIRSPFTNGELEVPKTKYYGFKTSPVMRRKLRNQS